MEMVLLHSKCEFKEAEAEFVTIVTHEAKFLYRCSINHNTGFVST